MLWVQTQITAATDFLDVVKKPQSARTKPRRHRPVSAHHHLFVRDKVINGSRTRADDYYLCIGQSPYLFAGGEGTLAANMESARFWL